MALSEQEYDFGGDAHGPDLSFFGRDKVPLFENRRVQPFVPDLVIEIVSENDRTQALFNKLARYRRYGTAEVWLLKLTTREALRYHLRGKEILGEDDYFHTDLIPGFSLRLGDLFDINPLV